MTSFVDALRRKYEKLTECHIFETFVQKSPNRVGANILFPARTLSMDCQQICRVGCEEELFRAAGHVAELDLAGNKLSCWTEIFTLIRCLRNLESLNLSQNPLGPNNANSSPGSSGVDLTEDDDQQDMERSESVNMPSQRVRCSPVGSPILRFASYESTDDGFGEASFTDQQDENRENACFSVDYMQSEAIQEKPIIQLDGSFERHMLSSKPCGPPIQSVVENGVLTPTATFPKLTVLALNATYVPWDWLLELLPRFPNLSTLHVALNKYGADDGCLEGAGDSFDACNNIPIFPSLRTLYLSDNGISSWWTVCRLVRHFPGLEHLVLLGNPIAHIPTPLPTIMNKGRGGKVDKLPDVGMAINESVTPNRQSLHLFACVHTLGLSETLISRWESIDALAEWMPKLTNLRLGSSLPVFQSWPEADCRAHVIARLPQLTTYNRSAVDSEERETAERDFVRYYGQVEPHSRPNRYWELERQHGRLEPLANIDLSPKRFIRVRVALDGRETVHELNVNLKVSQAKRQFLQLFDIDPSSSRRYKLFYFDQVMTQIQGPEELRFPTRAIHSYQPETGDLFELIRIPEHHQLHRSG
ncbi:tubulin-specific chaperone cofactor E-like protein [Paragonimus westermani]|uniref:Tubulin-specific chaperone cofactor E-like protein n=1 Tax=Paragonimus westermani TaxID=34504 RepID=A0A5J4NFV3_9TREM|nr:tubulin-specific chaperone cofactor E-like protein [Paragonimus westermani]